MKTLGQYPYPAYLHYSPKVEYIPAKIVLERYSENSYVSIHIPMTEIRELIAGLTEMADAHDAESRQEVHRIVIMDC